MLVLDEEGKKFFEKLESEEDVNKNIPPVENFFEMVIKTLLELEYIEKEFEKLIYEYGFNKLLQNFMNELLSYGELFQDPSYEKN